ncbi:MAG: aldo/keto reductase [Lachnospiraceae bacterium]|nr:aldo/keto reductase [Lachnospiraceae bacterium]
MNKNMILKNGMVMPRLGQGTWYMGENSTVKKEEIAALRTGIERGMTLIDTAEMYGDGASEILIGEALRHEEREKLFVVSKVYPHNAGKGKLEKSLDQSLQRLQMEYLDMYLLHWRGSIPFRETIECMEQMVQKGKIRSWGVSNLDLDEMEELTSLSGGTHCQLDQVLYHVASRGVEYSLLPWLTEHQMPLMAYCPMAQGGTLGRGIYQSPSVQTLSEKYGVSPAVILIAFVLAHPGTIAIPKASQESHVIENSKAMDLLLTEEDIALLSKDFPAPVRKEYLDIV